MFVLTKRFTRSGLDARRATHIKNMLAEEPHTMTKSVVGATDVASLLAATLGAISSEDASIRDRLQQLGEGESDDAPDPVEEA